MGGGWRIETGYDYKAFRSDDIWGTEDKYIILKITGEADNV